ANPPYLAAAQLGGLATDVRDHEPLVATVSGPTGLEVPARVVEDALAWLRPGGWLVMETWPGQADDLLALLSARYAEAAIRPDLTGSLRIAGARAALCNDLFTARLGRLHNDANVLAMGGRIVAPELAYEILSVFLDTAFEGGRHTRRLEQIAAIEQEECGH